jgi:hypothetical protein
VTSKATDFKWLLRIFLCHSSSDKEAVRDLYWRLRKDGFNPWLDEQSILPGQKWQQEIAKAVRASDIVIVCLSQAAVNKRGYIHKEIKDALDVADEHPEDAIFLIPVRLEECDVPGRLKPWHWVDLFQKGGYDRLVKSLVLRAEKDNKMSMSQSETVDSLMLTIENLISVEDSLEMDAALTVKFVRN